MIRRLALAVAVVAICGCAAPVPDKRSEAWRIDLSVLVDRIDKAHPALDQVASVADMRAAADEVAAHIEGSTDDELMVGVLRVVALGSAHGCDSHLGAYIWGDGTYPVDILPLRVWLFDDGVHVVDALPPFEALIGGLLETIGGHSTADVLAAVEALVPRDNDETVLMLTPRFLTMAPVLRGLGFAGAGAIPLKVHTGDGAETTVDVSPIPRDDYNRWAGNYGLLLPADSKLLYLSRLDDHLWWQRLDDGTLFVGYNEVAFTRADTLAALGAALRDPANSRVVLDIRHNYGGEVTAIDPMVDLFADPAVNQPGRLFVITGRNTYSAASTFAARLQARTKAIFVGEPMSGCPTTWGNSHGVLLPFSGIQINVPTTLEIGVSADDTRATIEPDIAAPLTFADWAAGIDPALAAINGSAGRP